MSFLKSTELLLELPLFSCTGSIRPAVSEESTIQYGAANVSTKRETADTARNGGLKMETGKTAENAAGRCRLLKSGIHKFTFRQQHSAQEQVIIAARV